MMTSKKQTFRNLIKLTIESEFCQQNCIRREVVLNERSFPQYIGANYSKHSVTFDYVVDSPTKAVARLWITQIKAVFVLSNNLSMLINNGCLRVTQNYLRMLIKYSHTLLQEFWGTEVIRRCP